MSRPAAFVVAAGRRFLRAHWRLLSTVVVILILIVVVILSVLVGPGPHRGADTHVPVPAPAGPVTAGPVAAGYTPICGSSVLQSPYHLGNVPALGTTTSVVTVATGTDSGTYNSPNTTYYFAPGTHQLAAGTFSSIQVGTNDWYVGQYSGGVGATLDGTGSNRHAFVGQGNSTNIEYLTIKNYVPVSGDYAVGAGVNITGAPSGWTVSHDTIQDNYPGSALQLGTDGVARYDCLTHNGTYGVQAYSQFDVSAITTGPSNVMVENSEISLNDQCNLENIPAAYFPLRSTLPSGCPAPSSGVNTCGCAGGAHFWNTYGTYLEDNYIHDNYDVASWWDTDNSGETITGNYYANNFAEATDIEISYNALISNNTFLDNANGLGNCGRNCNIGGNVAPAVYLSESGGDSRVPSPQSYSTVTISDNTFTDNWDNISLYENADRFCSSVANTSTGYCTLAHDKGESSTAYRNQAGDPPSTTYYANNGPTGGGCGKANLIGATSADAPDYFDDCRWKTQNVKVTGNIFNFNSANMSGCTSRPTNGTPCGENSIASIAGSSPSWSPYLGIIVPTAITTAQNNHFTNNTYRHSGAVNFRIMYFELGSTISIASWQSHGQDTAASGSIFS